MLEFTYSQLQTQLLTPFTDEREAIKSIKDLHNLLQERHFGQYSLDPRLVSAYTLFYLPTNFPKWNYLWNQLPTSEQDYLSQAFFLDIGSGPGSFILSFLANNPNGKAFGLEKSPIMRQQAEKLLSHYFPESRWSLGREFQRDKNSTDPLILFFGHSLCELGAKKAMEWVQKERPDRVAFIEPGDKATFKEVHSFREEMVKHNYEIVYPCLGKGKCPCPIDKGDWCHQVIKAPNQQEWQRLGQLLSIDRRYLPMIAHYYRKKSEERTLQLHQGRVFRFLGENKVYVQFQLCDSNLQLVEVEIEKKNSRNSLSRKELQKLLPGSLLSFKVIKQLSPTRWRIEVQEDQD